MVNPNEGLLPPPCEHTCRDGGGVGGVDHCLPLLVLPLQS